MKRTKIALSALLLASLSACNVTPSESNPSLSGNPQGSSNPQTSEAYQIKVWAAEEAQELTLKQLNDFKTQNPKFNVEFTLEAVGEGDAASSMITDVEAGADVFCFPQDQLARLVSAGALAKVSSSLVDDLTSANDSGSVAAATFNNSMYAYPLTSDNGYFMYYDKRYIKESSLTDMSAIIADCKENNKLFSFQLGTDGGWYNASFFFATGCQTTWTADDNGKLSSYVDTYNSANGLIAVKGMKELITSGVYNNASGAPSAFGSGSAVCISGTWDYVNTLAALGENMGVAELPYFTVDGTSYHLGSFGGYKLIGVKPQIDATKAAICALVAQHLTSETCQKERFDTLAWGPSNVVAQESEAVKANPALTALAAQSKYAIPQGQYPDGWWNVAAAIGSDIEAAGASATDEQLQAILDAYTAGLESCKQ